MDWYPGAFPSSFSSMYVLTVCTSDYLSIHPSIHSAVFFYFLFSDQLQQVRSECLVYIKLILYSWVRKKAKHLFNKLNEPKAFINETCWWYSSMVSSKQQMGRLFYGYFLLFMFLISWLLFVFGLINFLFWHDSSVYRP